MQPDLTILAPIIEMMSASELKPDPRNAKVHPIKAAEAGDAEHPGIRLDQPDFDAALLLRRSIANHDDRFCYDHKPISGRECLHASFVWLIMPQWKPGGTDGLCVRRSGSGRPSP